MQHLPHAVCPGWPSVVSLGVAQATQVPPGVGLYSSRGQGVQVVPLLCCPAGHPGAAATNTVHRFTGWLSWNSEQ